MTDSTATYGASSQNEIATAFCAEASEVSEWVRDPVKRQITITDARPSTTDDSPNAVSATDPATMPAVMPMTPSSVIQHERDPRQQPGASGVAQPLLVADRRRTWGRAAWACATGSSARLTRPPARRRR